MTSVRVIACLASILGLGACANNAESTCNRQTEYREAVSAATLRIPDDLSVPDESESLTIPGAPPADPAGDEADTSCIEESPAFSSAPQP